MGIRASSIEISNEEREYLELQTRARTMAQTVTRARILLLRADSVSIDAIADKVGLNRCSVMLCLKKFKEGGIENAFLMPLVRDKNSSTEYVEFLKLLDDKYPKEDKIRIVLDNLKVHTSEATRKYLATVPERFEFVFTPKHGSWLNMVEGFFSKTTRQMLRGIRVKFKEELINRIYRYFAEINEEPIVFHGNIISMILMYRKKSLLTHCLSKSRVN